MTKVNDINGNEIDFEAAAALMDDETREQVGAEMAPCSEQDFIEAYAKAHAEKFGEEFAPYSGLAW